MRKPRKEKCKPTYDEVLAFLNKLLGEMGEGETEVDLELLVKDIKRLHVLKYTAAVQKYCARSREHYQKNKPALQKYYREYYRKKKAARCLC